MTHDISSAESATVAVNRDHLVPVRIQVWHPEDWYLDLRTYLDELQIDTPPIEVPGEFFRRYIPSGSKIISLQAHTDSDQRRPWKFSRSHRPLKP